MADIHPDITPAGLNQDNHVDLLYMVVSSLAGICAKLDADGGVTDTDYEALCYTAIIGEVIYDSRGNRTGLLGNYTISPTGLNEPALIELYHDLFNAFETLTEKLDADGGITDVNYEALIYTAKFLWLVENQVGNVLGNGVAYSFKPGAAQDRKQTVDMLYAFVDAIETLTEKLDSDGGITDTDYEALWFTANVTLKVKDSKDNLVGN